MYIKHFVQKRELVEGLGIYIRFIELELCEQSSKNSSTGLMRALISLWYSRERLAACSATSGINPNIKTAIFSKIILIHFKVLY